MHPTSARWRGVLLGLVLLGLAGCATVRTPDYSLGLPPTRAERIELTQVPFHPQEDLQCGPAALATALQSAGFERTPEQLVEQVYLPQRQGSLQPELLGATRRAGALPYVLRAEPSALLRELATGHPVVVLQDVGWALRPQWHYAVVVGYDLADQTLTLRSGPHQRLVMPIAGFDRTWAKGGRWAFVALAADRLPATAVEADFVKAAADLERVTPTAAPRAYEAALKAWPHNLFARLALGNAAYRSRDLDAARRHYQRATADHPSSGDAWNNLATVLHEQGRRVEAQEAARRAVAIGGERVVTYQRTLDQIAGGAQVP